MMVHLTRREFIRGAVAAGFTLPGFVGWVMAAPRRSAVIREEAIARFLFGLAKGATWPDSTNPVRQGVLRIGLLGRTELSKHCRELAESVQAGWFNPGKVEILTKERPADLADCHVVFVGQLTEQGVNEAITFFNSRPTLLVSEAPGFVERGGAIGVGIENESLVFAVNFDTLRNEKSAVRLDSKVTAKASWCIIGGVRRTQEKGEI